MKVTVPKKGSVQVDKKKSNRKKKTTIDPRSKTHDGHRYTNGVSCHFFRGGICHRGTQCHFIHEDPGKSGEQSAYESDYSKNYKNKFPTLGEDPPKDSKAAQGSRQKGTKSILKNPKMRKKNSHENDGMIKVESSKASEKKRPSKKIVEGVSPSSVPDTKGVTQSRGHNSQRGGKGTRGRGGSSSRRTRRGGKH